ncbi:MAG: hypothetical protein KJ949_00960 [Nanoarchaeota archaeon]|nr:hypothetical protein [Nanoarchaeota archaeon]
MEYKATFGIDCGVSPGFGVKYPDYEKRDEVLTAKDDISAIIEVAKQARHFSKDYLSNPKNDLTTVTVLELYGLNRNTISIKKVLKDKGYDCIQNFEWTNEEKLVTKCSMLEHLYLTFESVLKE